MGGETEVNEYRPRPASASRMSLAFLTHPGQANPYGTLHGGVLLRLADECGAIAALRHAGGGQVVTVAFDSLLFLTPVRVGERVELNAEVTFAGRTSIESRIEIHAEPMLSPSPLERAEPRLAAVGYAVYVTLDEQGVPRRVPPLLSVTEADRRRDEAARARQAIRLALRDEIRRGTMNIK